MKIKTLLVILLAVLMSAAAIADWEYKVIYLPGTGAGLTTESLPGGVLQDTVKTNALNALGADGWEVIGITGDVGADHAVYLKRNK